MQFVMQNLINSISVCCQSGGPVKTNPQKLRSQQCRIVVLLLLPRRLHATTSTAKVLLCHPKTLDALWRALGPARVKSCNRPSRRETPSKISRRVNQDFASERFRERNKNWRSASVLRSFSSTHRDITFCSR